MLDARVTRIVLPSKSIMTKQASLGTDAPLDVDRLVESRLLIQANSGAGNEIHLVEYRYVRTAGTTGLMPSRRTPTQTMTLGEWTRLFTTRAA